jgi:hypothetical protein
MNINDIEHPNGTYVKLTLDDSSIETLQELQHQFNIPDPVTAIDMHLTLIYSRVPCPHVMQEIDNFKPLHGYI